jgi:TatA/E family protein of Tat protein translocase
VRCYHPGMPDLVIVLVIVLVVVLIWRGPKTLPSLGRAFGQGVKEARKEIDGMKSDKPDDETPPPPAT